MSNKKVVLIVRDGWGYSPEFKGNAIAAARTPFDDYLNSHHAPMLLQAHGPAVGLPEGFQGSSEVGHLNMGAARIVKQEVLRIYEMIESGRLFKTEKFTQILHHLKCTNAKLHLIGLLQDEGVHAHQEHLFYFLSFFKKTVPQTKVIVHVFSDGRDTPPRSVVTFLKDLEQELNRYRNASIGTLIGRYYAMDRSKNWELTLAAYDAICFAKGTTTTNIYSSIEAQYENNKTPDHYPMFDEYLPPLILNGYQGVRPEDVVINYSYRQDRAIQLSQAFVDGNSPIYGDLSRHLRYYGLTQYYDDFSNFLVPPLTNSDRSNTLVGKIISDAGLRQLRISETQKISHVTSFFNGKITTPFPLEDRIEIPSRFEPSTFASHPEMNATEITEAVLKKLSHNYSFILVNYANSDMVGHTGDFAAAVQAAEVVDENVEIVSKAALENGYAVTITSDHGNSEEMIDLKTGERKTSHTLCPVKLHLLNSNTSVKRGETHGVLSDIGTLILNQLDLPIPAKVTPRNLRNRAAQIAKA